MNQVPFLESSFIRYFGSILDFKRYFPTPSESISSYGWSTTTNIKHKNKILTLNGKTTGYI